MSWKLNSKTSKTVALFICAIILSASIATYVTRAVTTAPSTLTISSGVYPGAPTYTIWTESGVYYCKDANGLTTQSSTNASAVFQIAINDLPGVGEGGGGIIAIKAGAYAISPAIKMKSWASLVGEGIFTTFLYPVGSSNVIENDDPVGGNWFMNLRDLTIGPSTSGVNIGYDGINMTNARYLNVERCRVWYLTNNGIALSDGYQFNIINSIIEYNGLHGIYGDALVENGIHLVDSVIQYDGSVNVNIGGGSAHKIINCHIEGGNADASIVLIGAYSIISNNYIATAFTHGIYVLGGYHMINGNIINGAGDTGIMLEDASYASIFGNIIKSATTGISLTVTSSYGGIIGNSLQTITSNAVSIIGTADYNTISDNNCGNRPINIATQHCLITGNLYVSAITNSGSDNLIRSNRGFVTENSVSGSNTTTTTAVINHGLAASATNVQCSFNFTGWTSWTWTSTATEITITVTGTLPAAWAIYAKVEYAP